MPNHKSPEWLRLTLHWPRDDCSLTLPSNGGEAHKLAAKAAAAQEDDPRCAIVPEIFNHQITASGARGPKHGLSPFRFTASKTNMALTAVGNDAVDTLETYGHKLTRAISRMAGRPLQETWTHGALRLAPSKQLHYYHIDYAVLTRKPLRGIPVGEDLLAKKRTPAVSEWIEGRIMDGLVRQARLVGLPEPDEDTLLRLVALDGTCGWYRGADNKQYYGSVARGVTFASDLYIAGPWAIGSLCLVGEGIIKPIDKERGEHLEQQVAA